MRVVKTIVTITTFIFFVITVSALASEELPEGWRFPSEDDLKPASPTAINFREKSPSNFAKAEADFNGDGIQDKAYLLKSTKYNGQGLLVRLSLNKNFKWIVLDEIKREKGFPKDGIAMGIDIVKPQKIRAFSERPYDEGIEITLGNPGLAYFHFEGAGSVFYWDSLQMKFLRVWISD